MRELCVVSKRTTIQDILNSAAGSRNTHLSPTIENKPKRGKYGNTKVIVNNIQFDSKKEAARYRELIIFQKIGEISNLELQPEYLLIPKQGKERACRYIGDFRYTDKSGATIVEDVKSVATRKNRTYILKRKLMLENFGIIISEK